MAQKAPAEFEPLAPENEWIANAFRGVESDIPVLYTELRDVLQDGKVTIMESIEFGLTLPSPIKHLSSAVKAIRYMKPLSKAQKNAVLLAVAGDGGDLELGMNKAEAIVAYVDGVALAIDKEVKRFQKLAKILATKPVGLTM